MTDHDRKLTADDADIVLLLNAFRMLYDLAGRPPQEGYGGIAQCAYELRLRAEFGDRELASVSVSFSRFGQRQGFQVEVGWSSIGPAGLPAAREFEQELRRAVSFAEAALAILRCVPNPAESAKALETMPEAEVAVLAAIAGLPTAM
jgi:hypothetical protein